jgi:hypothetical protein
MAYRSDHPENAHSAVKRTMKQLFFHYGKGAKTLQRNISIAPLLYTRLFWKQCVIRSWHPWYFALLAVLGSSRYTCAVAHAAASNMHRGSSAMKSSIMLLRVVRIRLSA